MKPAVNQRDDAPRHVRWGAHVALLLITLFAHWLFLPSWAAADGFPLDDAWIHQVVARTFASSGTLGYAPGQHGAGATSYLWASVLATNFAWLHVSPVVFTLVVNLLLTVVGQQLLLKQLLDPVHDHRRWRAACAVATCAVVAFGGNAIWFTFSGMEAPLISTLSILAIVMWADGTRSNRTALMAGLACGLLALSRPECIALGMLLAVAVRHVRRPWRQLVHLAAPWALGAAVYFGSNILRTGSPMPATLGGRRWLWTDDSLGLTKFDMVVEFFADWLQRLREYTLGTSAAVLLWLGFGLALVACFDRRNLKATWLQLLVAWAAAHWLFYAMLLPTPGHGGRYQPLTPLLFSLGIGLGCRSAVELSLARWFSPRYRAHAAIVLTIAACAGWLAVCYVGVRDLGHDHVRSVSHIRNTEQAAGLAVRTLPNEAKVASFDIGASGFFADRQIEDIGGLSNADTVRALREGQIWRMLRDRGITHVILPSAYSDIYPDPVHFGYRLRLVNNPAVTLHTVREFSTPYETWVSGARATQHAAPRQVLSRLEFDGDEGPLPLTALGAEPPTIAIGDGVRLLERNKRQITYALRILAGAKVAVDLGVFTQFPAARAGEVAGWHVTLAQDRVRVVPPAGLSLDERSATAHIAQLTESYVDVGDFGGAAGVALWGVAELVRMHVDPRFLPPLPAVEMPKVTVRRSPKAIETVPWGLPLVLAIPLVVLGASRVQRRRFRFLWKKRGARQPALGGAA